MQWEKFLKFLKEVKEILFPSEETQDSSFVSNILYGKEELKKRYFLLKQIIKENDKILDIMAYLSDRKTYFYNNPTGLVPQIESILSHILSFIQALNSLTEERYSWLYNVFDRLQKNLMENILSLTKEISKPKHIYFLEEISYTDSFEVGGKAANLAEAQNVLGLTVPKGVVVSVGFFKYLLKINGLQEFIDRKLKELDFQDPESVSSVCKEIQKAILSIKIPENFSKQLLESLEKVGGNRWAVRSSAIGEDEELSFAGQFKSFLNIPTYKVIDVYLKVLASLYEERAMYYMYAHGINRQDISMAVLILEMINPKSSGVLYSTDPNDPEAKHMLISSVWGLGKSIVSGDIQPDIFVVDKIQGKLLDKNISSKKHRLVLGSEYGIEKQQMESYLQNSPSLSDEDIFKLYKMAVLLEEYFKCPQDIEWAMDDKGWIYLLQTRPLRVRRLSGENDSNQKQPFLIGEPISVGVACGPVYWIKDIKSLNEVPSKSIVITTSMNPELARIIPKISGLISLKGASTMHIATVLREFQVPAVVVSTPPVTLVSGDIITVDGFDGNIYIGRHEEILQTRRRMTLLSYPKTKSQNVRVEKILSLVLPLTLTEIPEDDSFSSDMIKTVHDLVRYVHEISIREMFLWSREDLSYMAHILDSPHVPMIFYIIDLEDGLTPKVTFKKKIHIEDIVSVPFLSLWKGMTHPKVKWAGAVPFNFGSFISIVSRSFVRTKEPPGKAFALISREYINFHSRLAYHFAAVESFCSDETPASNYVNFKFQGGGANLVGRLKRLEILKQILSHLGFKVDIKGDRLNSIVRGLKGKETQDILDQLGRLMAYVRQMDMAVANEDTVRAYIDAFLNGDYSVVHR